MKNIMQKKKYKKRRRRKSYLNVVVSEAVKREKKNKFIK
jgi:hypothetical protein